MKLTMPYRMFDVLEVENPFEQPGLAEEILIDALRAGQALRADATELDAPTRGGSEAYFEQVVHLRRSLIPHGWTHSNARNFCTVISPDQRHAIAIAQGTMGTGVVSGRPATARGLGSTIAEAIDVNVDQLNLWGMSNPNAVERALTWFLLSYREGDRIFSELSLPELRTESGVIYEWRQRWLLPELDLSALPIRQHDRRTAADASQDVIVQVSLKE